jgi:hypothetical protein
MGNVRKRLPVAWNTATATAASTPVAPSSPIPFAPIGPAYASSTDQRQSPSPPSPYTQGTLAVDHHCAFWAPGS